MFVSLGVDDRNHPSYTLAFNIYRFILTSATQAHSHRFHFHNFTLNMMKSVTQASLDQSISYCVTSHSLNC